MTPETPVTRVKEYVVPRGPASLNELIAEIDRTPLGRSLLGELATHNVRVTEMKATTNDNGVTSYGVYNPATNTLSVAMDTPWHVAMHIFAHEARHALQIKAYYDEQSLRMAFNTHANPVAATLGLRLREIDADIFAVYFLYDHNVTTGSDHFEQMATRDDALGRGEFYNSFYAAWLRAGGDHSDKACRAGMMAVARAWLTDPALPEAYDRKAYGGWQRRIFARYSAPTTTKDKEDFLDHAMTPPEQIAIGLARQAEMYAGILNEAGVPDYLEGITGGRYVSLLTQLRPLEAGAAEIVKDYRSLCDKVVGQRQNRQR